MVANRGNRETFVEGLSPKVETLHGVEKLNETIRTRGYARAAGPTSLSELTPEEIRRRFPSVENYSAQAQFKERILDEEDGTLLASDGSSRPAAWDWRNVNGKDWTTPIRDQGACGACSVFATIAAIETAYQIEQKKAYSGIDLSEGHVFFCGCGKCCGYGWAPHLAANFLEMQGVLDEQDYAYRPEDQNCGARECRYRTETGKTRTRISGWMAIADGEQAKNWISTKGPLVACMTVSQDFLSYKEGVYRPTTDTISLNLK